ncbi:hypothetical protein OHT68_23420 [Streptomyces canus]|uniref:hypothetical protein n=1 Tax=Streptomyces canus TaxID=58343 RepID=UPI002E2D51FB|nr:hypothetical protein [Streptomyces canus]
MLEPLGLPSHVSEIYRSLLRQPGSVEDLVSSLGWRPERVRSALDECVRLNLAKPSWGAPENLRAVSPEVSRATSVRASANSFCRSRSSFPDASPGPGPYSGFHRILEEGLRIGAGDRLPPELRAALALRVRERIGPYGWQQFFGAYLRSLGLDVDPLSCPSLLTESTRPPRTPLTSRPRSSP